jgi:hypothetical protein
MSRDFLKRLEKVEKQMNPPPPVQLPRIKVAFIRPDGTVAGWKIINPGPEDEIIEEMDDEDETD